MYLKFNPKNVQVTYTNCFSSREAFEDSLDDLLIATPENAKFHARLEGYIRVPQETVPEMNEKNEIIPNSKNGNGTIHAEKVSSVAERALVKQRILDYIEAQNIDISAMSETLFEIGIFKDDSDSKEKQSLSDVQADIFINNGFLETIFDFLDYIVPIISDDKDNFVNIENVIYATHFSRNDKRLYLKVISTCKQEISFLKQLWSVYIEYLRSKDIQIQVSKEGEKK